MAEQFYRAQQNVKNKSVMHTIYTIQLINPKTDRLTDLLNNVLCVPVTNWQPRMAEKFYHDALAKSSDNHKIFKKKFVCVGIVES